MADHKECKYYEVCDYRNDGGSCPDRCVQYKHRNLVFVVRCKDCRYYEVEPDDHLGICNCGSIAMNYKGEMYPERDHFCAYGERKDK